MSEKEENIYPIFYKNKEVGKLMVDEHTLKNFDSLKANEVLGKMKFTDEFNKEISDKIFLYGGIDIDSNDISFGPGYRVDDKNNIDIFEISIIKREKNGLRF